MPGFKGNVRFAVLLSLLLALPAGAQTWPVKPVYLYIASAPGGPVDLLARPVAQKLSPMLGQPAIVDFKPGADGIIVEVHQDPDRALSDGAQSQYPSEFAEMVDQIRTIAEVIGRRV